MNFEAADLAAKTAWRQLVERMGGVEATASACGIQRSRVSEYGDRHGDRGAPPKVILRAEHFAGEPLLTAAMARAQGYELVMVECQRGNGELANLIAELSKDIGELFATAAHALSHNKLTPKEMADLLREFGDAHRVTGEALALLKTMQEQQQ